jgi:hypothetical protein
MACKKSITRRDGTRAGAASVAARLQLRCMRECRCNIGTLILEGSRIVTIASSSLLLGVVMRRHVMTHDMVVHHVMMNHVMDHVMMMHAMMNRDCFSTSLFLSECKCRRERDRSRKYGTGYDFLDHCCHPLLGIDVDAY